MKPVEKKHRRKTTQVRFGFKSLNRPTPNWATATFGVATVLTTAAAVWVAGTAMLPEALKLEWVLALKVADLILLGISKLFGIERVP
jgi:hypothetical protein